MEQVREWKKLKEIQVERWENFICSQSSLSIPEMSSSEEINLNDVPIQVFEIFLEQEDYFPGELVSGKLLVLSCKTIPVEGISVKLEGRAFTKWKKRTGQVCGLQKSDFVEGRHTYFTNLFRYDVRLIPEGSSAFPFEFELPLAIPQSVRDGVIMNHARISYRAEALIRTTAETYRQLKHFLVKGLLNLNASPELALPVRKTVKEVSSESCWSSTKKIVVLHFSARKQGFVPGEVAISELLVKDCNEATFLSFVEVQLIQEVIFKANTHSHIKRQIVTKNEVMHAKSSRGEKAFTFSLKIPESILVSFRNHTEFIRIRYFLRVVIGKSSFPYKPMHIQLPVTIGSVWIKPKKAEPVQLSFVPLALPRPKISAGKSNSIPMGNGTMIMTQSHSIQDSVRNSAKLKALPTIMVHSASSHEKVVASKSTPISKLGDDYSNSPTHSIKSESAKVTYSANTI